MKPFKLSEYLKKYQSIIISISLVSGILCFLVIQFYVQRYQAQAIISYNYERADEELAPDGTALDITEIYSSNIITEVMDNLNIDKSTLNMDEIRGNITVEPLYSEEELALETARITEGENYKRKTNNYLITYSTKIFDGKEFPRKVLNEILDVYSKWFAENHINNTGAAKDIKGILDKNYDYFEMMETIDESIESNVNHLYSKMSFDSSFRSYKTGYTFSDIVNFLLIIKENETPAISARILSDSITKNKQVLISKYKAKNTGLDTQNKAITEELNYLETAKDTYVDLMDDSGNTSITSEYILKNINTDYNENKANQENSEYYVEYDRIMQSYVDNRYSFERNLIDKDYNSYLVGRFESSNVPDISEESAEAISIEASIRNIVDRVDDLYSILSESNDEFNEYLGAKYVNNLSSTSVSEKVPVVWLTLGIIMVFGVLGCGICVVIGRVTDIVDYYAYTDHIDGLPNRAKLDRFLEEKGRKSLIDDYACVNFKLVNLHEVNMSLGRTKGDDLIKSFANTLTEVFEPSDKVFVSNNGPGYYCVFAEGFSGKEIREMLLRFRRDLEVSDTSKDYKTIYQQGFAFASEDKCYDVKELMLLARRKLQASSPVNGTAGQQNTAYVRPVESNAAPAQVHQNNTEADAKYNTQRISNSSDAYTGKAAAAETPPRQNYGGQSGQRYEEYSQPQSGRPNAATHEMNSADRRGFTQKMPDRSELMSFTQELRTSGASEYDKQGGSNSGNDLFELNADYLSRYRNSRQ